MKITNSSELDVDDMYVKFTTDNNQNFGTGQWEETTEPGIHYQFKLSTMPHQLVRQANGTFTFSEVNWNERIVGDDETNPFPSFVDQHHFSHLLLQEPYWFLVWSERDSWSRLVTCLTSGIHQHKQQ